MDILKRISTKGLAKEYDFKRYPKGFDVVFRSYVQGATRKEVLFRITADEAYQLMSMPCHYCGSQPDNQTHEFTYNGMDQVVASDGYIADNLVPCCKLCNSMKSRLTIDEFLNHISKIYTWNEEDL